MQGCTRSILPALTSLYICECGVGCVTCVEGYMCMCACVNGGYRLVFSDFLDHSPFHFCLSLKLELTDWLVWPLSLPIPIYSSTPHWGSEPRSPSLHSRHFTDCTIAQCLLFWRTPGFSKAVTLLHSHQQWYRDPNFYMSLWTNLVTTVLILVSSQWVWR